LLFAVYNHYNLYYAWMYSIYIKEYKHILNLNEINIKIKPLISYKILLRDTIISIVHFKPPKVIKKFKDKNCKIKSKYTYYIVLSSYFASLISVKHSIVLLL